MLLATEPTDNTPVVAWLALVISLGGVAIAYLSIRVAIWNRRLSLMQELFKWQAAILRS